jgi:cobalamin biosynthesis protein CobD/CbiB
MGNARYAAKANDIRAALELYRRADAILIGLVAMLAAAVIAIG